MSRFYTVSSCANAGLLAVSTVGANHRRAAGKVLKVEGPLPD